jgi:hypothetical protein
LRVEACASVVPPLDLVRDGHESACLRQRELAAE